MVEYSPVDQTFSAIADPTRRAIIQILMSGPSRVTELSEPFSVSLNAISKHLKILERAGLVSREVRGREHWIRFNRAPLQDARSWVDSMLTFWDSRLDKLEDLLEQEEEQSND